MKKKKDLFSLIGFLLFFITNAVVVTVSVLVYDNADKKFAGKTSTVVIIMFVTILFFTAAWTLIDAVRRRVTVMRPVERILDATERIARGDFSVRLEISHSYKNFDEFDIIADNLNKMSAELSKTEVLHTDFMSNVSHELKTPLSIIQSYAMAMQNQNLDKATAKEYAATLVSASKRLTELVTNILKLNKLENQQLKPQIEKIKLDEMLAQSILQYEEKIDEKQLDLCCDLDEVNIYSDASCLEIIFNNLISNAIKFTEAKGKISVSLTKHNNQAVVSVADTGCGISKSTGEHIFDKFYQGDTSHAQEGNGLGLALVKKVIDILGGEISVESEEGKGTTFTVKLNSEM